MQTAMGQWMRWQGYSVEQVQVYEAYLQASREGREFVCLLRRYWPIKKGWTVTC